MPQDTPVDLAVTRDAVRPRALAVDKLDRLRPDLRHKTEENKEYRPPAHVLEACDVGALL